MLGSLCLFVCCALTFQRVCVCVSLSLSHRIVAHRNVALAGNPAKEIGCGAREATQAPAQPQSGDGRGGSNQWVHGAGLWVAASKVLRRWLKEYRLSDRAVNVQLEGLRVHLLRRAKVTRPERIVARTTEDLGSVRHFNFYTGKLVISNEIAFLTCASYQVMLLC